MEKNNTNIHYAALFNNLQRLFKSLIGEDVISYKTIINAVNEGIVDPDLSIAENVNSFILSVKDNKELIATKEFSFALENFRALLESSEKDINKLKKIYHVKLIELILSKKLVPYNQVDISRMYFLNPNKSDESKHKFLNEKIDAILNGGNDFRMIKYLDKINIDPKFLRNSFMYQELIHKLIMDYVKDYDKYHKKGKVENEKAREIIRMIYRHQNKGFHELTFEERDVIVSAYGYNGWFVELKHMISKNNLGINKENYMHVIETLKEALIDMTVVCKFNDSDYLKMAEKFDELYKMISEVALEEVKLIRKEG